MIKYRIYKELLLLIKKNIWKKFIQRNIFLKHTYTLWSIVDISQKRKGYHMTVWKNPQFVNNQH